MGLCLCRELAWRKGSLHKLSKKRTRTKSEAIRTIVSKKDMENLKSLSWEKLLRTLKRCDFFRNFDFSEFSVQLNANISKTRMFLDLQFFEVIKKNYNYDIKRFHKQFIRSFWKNLLQKWKNTNFCLFFAPFLRSSPYISRMRIDLNMQFFWGNRMT